MYSVLYMCDPDKNEACNKFACYLNDGPCKCTAHKENAKTGENDKPIVALASDYYDGHI